MQGIEVIDALHFFFLAPPLNYLANVYLFWDMLLNMPGGWPNGKCVGEILTWDSK